MRRLSLALASGILLLAALPGSALADPPGVIDQINDYPGSLGGAYSSFDNLAQTFTVGQTGQLTGVQLWGNGSVAIDVSITAVDGDGHPTGAALASTSATPPGSEQMPAWIDFVFSPTLAVTAGQHYAIVFNNHNDSSNYYPPSAYTYAAGAGLVWKTDEDPAGWYPLGLAPDWSFRTWVVAARQPTPPPTAMSRDGSGEAGIPVWLAALGLMLSAGASLLVRKRQPRRVS